MVVVSQEVPEKIEDSLGLTFQRKADPSLPELMVLLSWLGYARAWVAI